MKRNNKGFMLAEVVIVSTIILTSLTALYKGLNKTYIGFNRLSTYHSIDAIYASSDMFNNLLDNYQLDSLMNGSNCTLIDNDTYPGYSSISSTYKVNKMYFVPKGKLDSCNIDFADDKYISYLKIKESKIDGTKTLNDVNLIVTEIKDDNNYYYGYYEVR